MLRILVTGADGLLAQSLMANCPKDVELLPCPRARFDLTQPDLMARQLDALKPDVVVNTAAYNLVERCEVERDLSWRVNATGPQLLSELCARAGVRLVHYGTDYVFDGGKGSPYVEADPPNPLNHYAAGKLAGEQAVLDTAPGNLVLRTSWVFGSHPTQTKSYVHTVLRALREGRPLKGTTDQVSVPTFAPDLACWTLDLIRLKACGLVHAVNNEPVSRYEWTGTIVEVAVEAGLVSQAPAVQAVTTAHFNSTMRRPVYSALSNQRLASLLGRRPGSWRAGLRKMLAHQTGR
jgi:dTDP-4-dehydrorhamnose reductase